MKPICIDLFCGLGGWAEGFLAEGWRVIGFDIEAHDYGTGGYPDELILRDVRSIHGSEFKDASCIVGSSPCQEFSYRAMPWKKAKELPPPHLGMQLFDAQFRIQREASEAAGHHIPLVVENVRGAQRWVGTARWHYGSFYLWGDVPALMPTTTSCADHLKVTGPELLEAGDFAWNERKPLQSARRAGLKLLNADGYERNHRRKFGWKSPRTSSAAKDARKRASALIAKIPFPLAVHIAKTFKPRSIEVVA